MTTADEVPDLTGPLNTVTLRGRITAAPTLRELPSGDPLVTFRLVVTRPRDRAPDSRRRSDWFDCAVWGGRVLPACQAWEIDDVVEVRGALRRRHFRTGETAQSRVEVAVATGRRLRRAPVA